MDQRTRAQYRRLGGPPGVVALAVAAWVAAAAFLTPGGPAVRAESQPVFRDQHYEFTVERNGRTYTVRIEQLIVDDGSGGFDDVAASAKAEALSRFAGATEAIPGEVTAQFVRASYSWAANTASWGYNSVHKPSSLTPDASVVGAAAATWGKAGANFTYSGGAATTLGTGACHDVPDGSNTVGWATQTGTTLASTCTWYDNRGGAIEFDMEIDPEWNWTTSPTNPGVDLQSVTLHEFGHALGLNHSTERSAVMFGTYSGGTLKGTLTADDLAGVQAIYGLKATPPGGGGDPPATPTGPAEGLEVAAGANLLTWPGPNVSAVVALSADKDALRVVYGWEASTETWTQFGPMLPGYANTLSTLRQGSAYWFIANRALVIPLSP